MGRNWFSLTVLSLILWGMLGCGGSQPKPKPECKESEQIFMDFKASPDVNRDLDGNPRSTYLRVYQLSRAILIEQTTFEEIWSEPESLFADALLDGPRELIIKPGEDIPRRLIRHPEAYLILIVGNFRQTQGNNRWRAKIALPAPGETCAQAAAGAQPPPLAIDILLKGYQIFSRTNFRANSYFENVPSNVSSRVEADPDWREPGSQPRSPRPVVVPRPAVSRSIQYARPETRETAPSARPSVPQTEEESSPARNPRLRRRKKKAPPPSIKEQEPEPEPEVPLL